MDMISGVVFDLDDTLYLERDYVRSGFAQVAGRVGAQCGISSHLIFQYLWDAFQRGTRGTTFGLLLNDYPEVARHFEVQDLVNHYRNHAPSIRVLDGADLLLRTLQERGVRVGVLSDGPLNSQVSKVAALGLKSLCSPIVLTDTWGREYWKPHVRGFEEMAESWKLQPRQLVYVGDNPEKDFKAPNALGWCSVRLKMEGQLRLTIEPPTEADAPSIEMTGFDALCRWMEAHMDGGCAITQSC